MNEYLFSLHLNADLYTKLTLTQLSLLYETTHVTLFAAGKHAAN